MTNKVRLYGCGGAGVNIVSNYATRGKEPGCAELIPSLIDTSASNLRSREVPEESVYQVEGLDGSGKIRSENHAEINKVIKEVLVKMPPTDFNIVVFSTSGGSGSVIGPLLMKELMSRGIATIAVVVGSDESVIAAENTLKTLQSLELISKKTETPLVMSYHHNDQNTRRSQIDKEMLAEIGSLAILASGENLEMDRLDLVHWLNYTKVNGGTPRLSTLDIAMSGEAYSSLSGVLSVASLYNDADQERIVTSADYHSDGLADLSSIDLKEVHFAIGVEGVGKIGEDIKKRVAQMKETREARVERNSLLDGVNSDDDDLVL
ncbi:MAG: hypothetical protein CL582_10335 [Alteromonadaceae bacterium]|nr:hypothetical protein [Alteromonadaceae bacterium]|tara:strand:+ start:6788 stop:7747 length:960 start_codon:yes stop_codon:yes gene_type:complete